MPGWRLKRSEVVYELRGLGSCGLVPLRVSNLTGTLVPLRGGGFQRYTAARYDWAHSRDDRKVVYAVGHRAELCAAPGGTLSV